MLLYRLSERVQVVVNVESVNEFNFVPCTFFAHG